MNRRSFILAGSAAFVAGGTMAAATPNPAPDLEAARARLIRDVFALSPSQSRSVSLGLLRRPETMVYIDENDLPAARWRGADDLGACVHIRPDTKALYLETQFPASVRADKAPKYIQFGHEGPWHSRRHNGFDKMIGTERNWIDERSEVQATALLDLLDRSLGNGNAI